MWSVRVMRLAKFIILALLPVSAFAQSFTVNCQVLSVTNKELPRQYPNDRYGSTIGSLLGGGYFSNIPSSVVFAATMSAEANQVPVIEQNIVVQLLESDRSKVLVTQVASGPNLMYPGQACFYARDSYQIKVIPR